MPIDPKALADHLNGIADDPNGYISIAEAKALAALITALSEKLRVAREAIENAPHHEYCAGWWSHIRHYPHPTWIGVRTDKCNCWKSRALTALDATQPEAPTCS